MNSGGKINNRKQIVQYEIKYEYVCEGLLCDVILVAMETAAGNVLQIKPT